jgi:hypothetical protein
VSLKGAEWPVAIRHQADFSPGAYEDGEVGRLMSGFCGEFRGIEDLYRVSQKLTHKALIDERHGFLRKM